MKYLYYLIIITLLLPLTKTYAQYGTLGSQSIYDKNRNKKEEYDPTKRTYDIYDIQKFIDEQKTLKEQYLKDSTKSATEQKLFTTPEELRKLGVPDEVIQQLLGLTNKQDSLKTMGEEMERKRREDLANRKKKRSTDTLSITDLQTIIGYQKEALIEKALSLPEPIMYGQEFFRRNLLDMFTNEPDMRPSSNYILGENDEINITIWGNIDYNQAFTIDKSGSINPPLVGRIYLKGIEYSKAQEIIKQNFSKKYNLKKSNLAVSITYARIVAVNFVGELLNPGTYKLPAATSVYNALVAISGPNQIGSVRNIFIQRNGTTIKTLDLYEYLSNPNSKIDFFLEDNDYIVVPAKGGMININGEIERPHNYEIKKGEGLESIIKYAGNLKSNAFTKTINIKRYQNNKEILIDVNLDSLRSLKKDFMLENGDSIFVYPVPVGLRNYVQVQGAVNVPGKYEIKPGDKVSSILKKTTGIKDDADLTRAYVIRLKPDMSKQILPFRLDKVLQNNTNSSDDIVLQNLDTIKVVSRADFRQSFTIKVFGEVRMPGEYEYAEGLTLKDVLYLAGGLKKEAANNRIEVSRVLNFNTKDPDTGKENKDRIVIKRIEVNTDLTLDMNSQNFALSPYDHVFIRTSPDFETPQVIKIYGEVVYPGEYTLLNKEEKVTSIIDRCGGLTKYALQEGAQLYRKQDSLGYVLLDLNKAYEKPDNSKFNYILISNDSIYIPKTQNIVTLSGAIAHYELDSIPQISVPYEIDKKANYYIKEFGGGFSRYAKKTRTYVRQPNGEVDKTQKVLGLFKQYPKVQKGATIYVDVNDRKKNEEYRKRQRERRNWNDAFDSVTSKIATILTVVVLAIQASKL